MKNETTRSCKKHTEKMAKHLYKTSETNRQDFVS